MTNQWFRFYNTALNNPKVQKLSGDLFKTWINILCVTSQCDGIPNVTELSFYLRVTESECQIAVDELIKAGLLHAAKEGFIPHDWEEMQYKSDTSSDRTKRWRDRHKNVTVTSHVTPPDQIRSDTDQIRAIPSQVTFDKKSFVFSPSDDTHSQVVRIAPGWDRQALYSKFSEWIRHDAKELPTDPQKAFLGWVPKFTADKKRTHYQAASYT